MIQKKCCWNSKLRKFNPQSVEWRSLHAGLLALLLAAPSLHAQEPHYSVQADVVYGHKDGMALTYDVFVPSENANGVGILFMVSGGWVSRWTEPEQAVAFLGPVLKAGYTVIAVRHGSSPRYIIPEIAVDIRKALEHIDQHVEDFHIDRKRLGVFGFSAGGHLSLLLGTQTNHQGEAAPHVAAVVAVFPPTDLGPYVDPANPLRERFPALKFDPSLADQYSPLKHVSEDDAPTLLIHGDKDELVPIWHSQKIDEAFEQAKVEHELITIQDAGHGFDADGNKRMFEAMVHWFDQHLAP
ncbi:MAG: alpha/beta hydrolase [Planctomycetales bacterium]|nr:alpha/beta hydrolase [Planctomycetales bacterium]